jgi:hypothetical protein
MGILAEFSYGTNLLISNCGIQRMVGQEHNDRNDQLTSLARNVQV